MYIIIIGRRRAGRGVRYGSQVTQISRAVAPRELRYSNDIADMRQCACGQINHLRRPLALSKGRVPDE